ncbi:VOC family protein [Desulfitobacterium chlororespirans]|uniref:Glyoxalase/Bleomycin resistance protein/Dioxygenase superfamily protein n=1 Tax=Desulfitobacterium chlororespirans DSM 11544 TaxID=1121395 RepID=A0A1M7SJD5_9FIRM|nr:VOC family protein [Desulfitobacterium chlororespirans]SHN58562.1 Glyoxalase/Bleomycin resistance protein/Dioxygenase superfamily protein [Desulfitobacterium chlororespirans DSM 11544]
METILNKYATNQISYYVKDLEAAARAHSALFGSGPFFYMDPLTTKDMNYRGQKIDLTMQTAFGQFGDLQIELVQVFSEPNPYAELGHYGFHHFSNWVDDFEGALREFAAAGFEPLFSMQSAGGLKAAYIDCKEKWGHYVEIHAPSIKPFWEMIRKASLDWDGKDIWRKLG